MSDPSAIIKENCFPLQPIPTGLEPRLEKLPDIRAVAFDIYGTLLISGSGDIGTLQKNDPDLAQAEAMQSSLQSIGLNPNENLAQLYNRFQAQIKDTWQRRKSQGVEHPEVEIRVVWQDFLDSLDSDGNSPKKVTPDIIEALAIAFECKVNPVWPMPGIHRTLFELRAAGLPLGIVSNAQFYTPLQLENFKEKENLAQYFDPALCNWSYIELEAKPSVRLFANLRYQLGKRQIAPEQTLYIGNDLLNDILPAAQTGFRTALFAGDQRSLRLRKNHPLCQGLTPDLIITSLHQLSQCL